MSIIKKYLLSAIIILGLIWVAFLYKSSDVGTGAKITLIALVLTALIYSFQLIAMNEQKDMSEKSFRNQENILKEQKDIAKKQYDFNVFTMRMNLRNSLKKSFTFSLSAHNYDIENNVNDVLLTIEKICNDIKFAFPANNKLDGLILKFKEACVDIIKLAPEKETMIECGEKHSRDANNHVIRYKDCLQVWSDGQGKLEQRIINQEKFDSLKISSTKKDIILGIMAKYIDSGQTKDHIVDYLILLFKEKMKTGNNILNQIFDILDQDIKLD